MKYNIDVYKIRDNKAKIKNEIEEINDLCKKCYERIDGTIAYFDTPTAKVFRDKAIELIEVGEDYIRDSLIPFVDSIDDCTNMYEDLLKEISDLMAAIDMNTGATISYETRNNN